MKASIIGGGIGGFSTARALERVGIRCDVFEQAEELREVGSGLTAWGQRGQPDAGSGLLDRLQPDVASTTTGLRPAAVAEFRNSHNHEPNL